VLIQLAKSLRLKQVIKNSLLLVGLVFSRKVFDYPDNLRVLVGVGSFTLISWAVYLFNDIQDRALDRHHLVKRHRPIASGALPVPQAYFCCAVLLGLGLTLAAALNREFMACGLAYLGLNLLYSRTLKHMVLLDIMAIAAGFWLRIIAGTQIIEVAVSHWLMICSIFLSLFLGFCKRRAELGQDDTAGRPILREYSLAYLDQLIAALTAAVILSYLLYTISAETVARFGTDKLLLSTPFVLYGVFRYLYLLHCQDRGQDTASDLLSDPPLLLAAAGWVVSVVGVIYIPII